MKNNNNKLAMILFVISTILILGSSMDVYANDSDGVRGTTGDGDLEGCLNGPAGDQICNTAAEWSGQNISHDAMYFEGNSIPIRVDITDLDPTDGLVQKLIIDWDITKSQGGVSKHTFDYITSFDTTDNPHPCLLAESTPRCDGFVSATIPIPPPEAITTTETVGNSTQPIDSFNAQPDNNKLFYMFAPSGSELEILHIDYVSEGDPTGQASNTETNVLFVEFTTNSTNVIAAFGAHISSPEDWINTASDVNGSPYRVGCVEIKEQGGCNASINISSNVIVPVPDSILTLTKEVVNDNGGNAGASKWKLTATDANNITLIDEQGTPDTVEDITATVEAISIVGLEYTLSESNGPLGYSAQNNGQFTCVKTLDQNDGQPFSTNTITLNEGESAVCTITNDDIAPKLTIIKDPTNNSGGNAAPDDFLLTVDGGSVLSGETNSYSANTPLAINETQLAGYTFVSITGDAKCPASLGGSVTLDEGDDITCTITNDDIGPKLTIIKDPTNNSGGNAAPDDFLLTVDGGSVLSGETNSYSANTPLAINETQLAGYTFVSITGDAKCPASLGGSVTLDEGDDITCTITNDDIGPKLTIIKDPTNNSGGNAAPDDFLLTVDGGSVLSGETNSYSANTPLAINETQLAGYTFVSITGDAKCPASLGGSVTLDEGDDITCTITNDDIGPKLTIIKDPTNNSGGNAAPDDFLLTVDGGSVLSGETNSYSANTPLAINETQLAGYTFVSITGDAKCPASLGGSVTLDEGDDITCTITNDDIGPKLTIIKDPTNDDGGNAAPDDFLLTVDGGSVLSGETNSYSANTPLAINETQLAGYTFVSITGDAKCPASLGGSVTLDEGDDITCTITNDDIGPKLTIIKDPTNNSGGNAAPDDFLLTVDGGSVLSGETNSYSANTPLAINETQLAGYTFVSITGDAKCPASLGGSVTLDEGDDITCTITNDDIAPKLTIIKDPTNDDGGNAAPDDFLLTVDGGSVLSGETNSYSANTDLTLGETQLSGYAFVSVTGDEQCPADLNTTFQLSPGDDVTCTITNDDVDAILTVIKEITNNDGGDALPDDFNLTVNDVGVLSGVAYAYDSNIDLTIGETQLSGYAFVSVTGDEQCPADLNTTFQLVPGDDVTCTITNDDVAPQLKLVKDLTQDNGGEENSGDWDLSAVATTNNARDFTDVGNSDVFHEVFANDSYHLSELGPSNYIPNAWTCLDASQGQLSVVNDKVTLQVGDEVICTINNDDIPPGLTLKMTLVNGVDGQATESEFVLSADGPTGFFGDGPQTGSGPGIVAGDYDIGASGPASYSYGNWVCSEDMVDFDTISMGLGDAVLCSIVIEFIDNCPEVINPDQIDSDNDGTGDACEPKGGMNHWDTRPSFGVNHETRETMVVDSGFTFNGNSFTVTDNHHTPFDEQLIEIGAVNTFEATVWAVKDLKVQEFLFGVPEIGMGHLAEMRVEVWFDYTGDIEDIKVIQESEVIDKTSLSISHQKVKCQEKDTEEKCDKTSMSAVFLEPLADNVMAIKAMDFKLRDQTTYLNDGFDISGDSLNPMLTKMIPSPTKGEGLIKVTQNEKYSDYWTSDNGRIFEMNSFGSFQHINYSFERFQDGGNAFTRQHSNFDAIVNYEKQRASEIFDATALVSELPDSFTIDMPIGERITEEMIQEMIIQEHIAQKKLDKIMNQQTRWN